MSGKVCECGCGREVKNRFIRGHFTKGKPNPNPPIPKGSHLTEEHKEKDRLAHLGKKNPKLSLAKKGHIVTVETRLKLRLAHLGKHQSDETKRKLSFIMKGKPKPPSYAEKRRKIWDSLSFAEKNMRIRKNLLAALLKPNKCEILLDSLIQKVTPNQFRYIGDGRDGLFFGKLPDWISYNNERKIIELFGDRWHSKNNAEEERRQYFKQYGYETLIIWGHELRSMNQMNQVQQKLIEFAHI